MFIATPIMNLEKQIEEINRQCLLLVEQRKQLKEQQKLIIEQEKKIDQEYIELSRSLDDLCFQKNEYQLEKALIGQSVNIDLIKRQDLNNLPMNIIDKIVKKRYWGTFVSMRYGKYNALDKNCKLRFFSQIGTESNPNPEVKLSSSEYRQEVINRLFKSSCCDCGSVYHEYKMCDQPKSHL